MLEHQDVAAGCRRKPLSIPTLASKANYMCSSPLGRQDIQSDTKTDTRSTAPSELGVTGVYPERFAQEALGHNSKAMHRAYAKRALMKLPSLQEYEERAALTGATTV